MHQIISERKRQALIRVASTRMQVLASVENSTRVVQSWRQSLPGAQSLGKVSLGLGLSCLVGKAVGSMIKSRLSRPSKSALPALPMFSFSPLTAGAGIFRYLLVQGFTLFFFPFLRSRLSGIKPPRLSLSLPKPNINQLFYRWLGLEG